MMTRLGKKNQKRTWERADMHITLNIQNTSLPSLLYRKFCAITPCHYLLWKVLSSILSLILFILQVSGSLLCIVFPRYKALNFPKIGNRRGWQFTSSQSQEFPFCEFEINSFSAPPLMEHLPQHQNKLRLYISVIAKSLKSTQK
jgi:hypothetical protein